MLYNKRDQCNHIDHAVAKLLNFVLKFWQSKNIIWFYTYICSFLENFYFFNDNIAISFYLSKYSLFFYILIIFHSKKKTITNCFSYCFFNFKFFENNKFSIEIRLHDFFPRTFNKQKEGYIKFIYLIHEKYKISMTP